MIRGLCLTHSFAPSALPESYVLAKSLGNIPGIKFDIVCSETAFRFGRDDTLGSYVNERFGQIIRVPLARLTKVMPHSFNPFAQLPDLFVYSNPGILKVAESLDLGKYSILLTSSMWHSSHLIGLKLNKKYPHLKWISRFSDPWVNNPFLKINPLCLPYNRKLEFEVFSHSDKVVFTSAQCRDSVRERLPKSLHSKITYLPHCFDKHLYPAANTAKESQSQYLLRHLGHFYGHRSPWPLYEAVESLVSEAPKLLDGVKIELIGSLGRHTALPTRYPEASKIIRIVPPVKYLDSLRLMNEADCLLVIDAPDQNSVFLPSKLIDYLGTGRALLAITPRGASRDIVERVGGEIADPSDINQVRASLRKVLTDRPRVILNPSNEFSINSVCNQWQELLIN